MLVRMPGLTPLATVHKGSLAEVFCGGFDPKAQECRLVRCSPTNCPPSSLLPQEQVPTDPSAKEKATWTIPGPGPGWAYPTSLPPSTISHLIQRPNSPHPESHKPTPWPLISSCPVCLHSTSLADSGLEVEVRDGFVSQMSSCSNPGSIACAPGQATEPFSALMTSSIELGIIMLVKNVISLRIKGKSSHPTKTY